MQSVNPRNHIGMKINTKAGTEEIHAYKMQ